MAKFLLRSCGSLEIDMDKSNLESYKVFELRGFLSERGLPTTGVKASLIERLRAALDEEENEVDIVGDSAPVSEEPFFSSFCFVFFFFSFSKEPAVTAKDPAPTPAAPEAPKTASSGAVKTTAGTVTSKAQPDDEHERRRQRAARFGIPLRTEELVSNEAKAKRGQKYGTAKRERSEADSAEEARRKARGEKYGTATVEDKNQARAKRFSLEAPAGALAEDKLNARAE